RDELPEVRVPLVAASSVEPGGFMVKVTAAAMYLFARLNAGPQDAS
ncbi:MAG: D-alanyl-D-alanine carboxypeptidase, partial [Rhodobacteraceae bacterium]|nr:D-alanyl-D-alanine carboxypeptidase [Paracoccaceae bacterium]